MRISDWSSDVCSSDLLIGDFLIDVGSIVGDPSHDVFLSFEAESRSQQQPALPFRRGTGWGGRARIWPLARASRLARPTLRRASGAAFGGLHGGPDCRSGTKGQPPLVFPGRSEEHTSELQSLMRISYAVFCLKKKKKRQTSTHNS